jgi:molybdopterin-guanine dinucleotide biosynthesis protein A
MLRRAMSETAEPIGVVLAGGAGRRMGGGKAALALAGKPLLAYPVGALRDALAEVVVVAKGDVELPPLDGVETWIEPDAPRHPLAGIVHALIRARGRAVLVCAGDLPFVTAALVRTLAEADAQGAPVVVPRAGERLQPLLARYEPAALAPLRAALEREPAPLRDTVAALGPRILSLEDGEPFFNVNAPADLLLAAAMLDRHA